ncbi:MAG: translation initiation factor [Deltaproteobacteria bacterium]|nr:translation initiation factor [Deltaproteobacteria bacterium]
MEATEHAFAQVASCRKIVPMSVSKTPFHNPFEALGASRLRRGAQRSPPARAVVRLQRKGRAGKEVTVVEKLGLEISEAEGWLRDLKRELGCGGMMEDDVLVFQGDHRERLGALLRERGVRKLSIG